MSATITAEVLDDGEGPFLRVNDLDGEFYDQPIAGWERIIDLVRGRTYFRHKDGTEYTENNQGHAA